MAGGGRLQVERFSGKKSSGQSQNGGQRDLGAKGPPPPRRTISFIRSPPPTREERVQTLGQQSHSPQRTEEPTVRDLSRTKVPGTQRWVQGMDTKPQTQPALGAAQGRRRGLFWRAFLLQAAVARSLCSRALSPPPWSPLSLLQGQGPKEDVGSYPAATGHRSP